MWSPHVGISALGKRDEREVSALCDVRPGEKPGHQQTGRRPSSDPKYAGPYSWTSRPPDWEKRLFIG